MKKIIPLVIIFFLVVSNLFAQAREELNYYPLHVGDVWQYKGIEIWGIYPADIRSQWLAFKKIVSDTILADGKKYYVVKETKLGNPYFPNGYKFVRVDSLSGLVYGINVEPYILKIDSLFAKQGDRVTRCDRVDFIQDKLILSELRKTRGVNQVCTSSTSYQGYELSMGLGEVTRYYNDIFLTSILYNCNLVYAKINGKEYGTFVGVNEQEIIPSKYSLSQNYPNPFNPTTKIKFSIPAVETRRGKSLQYVTLKVFDILGYEIATLVNEEKLLGDYEVTVNGNNLASGVYFYRLTTKDFSLYKKMILIK